MKHFLFENIHASNCHVAAIFFEGLPEQKIKRSGSGAFLISCKRIPNCIIVLLFSKQSSADSEAQSDGNPQILFPYFQFCSNSSTPCSSNSSPTAEYSVADSALTPGFACYLKNLFAEAGIDIAVLGCYLNLANPNEESLKKNQARYLANIRFASLLGAGVVGTETVPTVHRPRLRSLHYPESAVLH